MARKPKPSGARCAPKDKASLLRHLKGLGMPIQVRSGGHLCVETPRGVVVFAATPGDSRAVRNVVAELRRHGVEM